MRPGEDPFKWLRKKSNPRLQGWPVGTLLYYGPDDKRATKAVVCIFGEGRAPLDQRSWFNEVTDIRRNVGLAREMVEFLRSYQVRRVGLVERIVGCPHDEGVHYAKGETCPHCGFWATRARDVRAQPMP